MKSWYFLYMNRRLRRLAYRAAKMAIEGGLDSQEMLAFAAEHPQSMKAILQRLNKDNVEALKALADPEVKPLLGPGDED